jgi:hypothetical protein
MTESYDASDFWVESMSCSSLGKVPSRTKILYWDRVTLEKRPAYACDLAILWKQGSGPVIQELDYSAFVCSADLANTIAARDQQAASAMPKSLVLRALRTMAHLKETDVIQISYPELNIASMIVRVAAMDRGSLADGECIVQVIEDVFRQEYTVYASAPGAGTTAGEEVIEDIVDDTEGYSEITFETDSTEALPSASSSPSASFSSSGSASPSASASV